MMRSFLLVSALALVGLLVGCQPHPPKPGEMIDRAADRVKSELSLTDGQQAKFQDLVGALKELVAKRQPTPDSVRTQVDQLILAPALDTDQVRALIHDREATFQKDFDAALDALLPKLAAFTDSLTADQKKKVVDFLDTMGKHWQER